MKKLLLILACISSSVLLQSQDIFLPTDNGLSSYAESGRQRNSRRDILFNARKNAVFIDFMTIVPILSYSRLIPFTKNMGMTITTGGSPFFGGIAELEGSVLSGRTTHFAELGGGYWFLADNAYLKLSYRYHGINGLMVRISPGWSISENTFMLTAGFGYAF